jgi:hypothetical protein
MDGIDCSLEQSLCTAIPDEPLRVRLGPPGEKDSEKPKPGVGSR